MSLLLNSKTRPATGTEPFIFPLANSTRLPNPSKFFSPELLASPLPTNSFFQNFVLKNGEEPEYIHPYLVMLSSSSLSLCYPFQMVSSSEVYQVNDLGLTISSGSGDPIPGLKNHHVISSFSDLSVTVDFPARDLRFFLVRGSPYLTCSVLKHRGLKFSAPMYGIASLSCDSSRTKYTIKYGNNQVWLVYTSSPISLYLNESSIMANSYTGILRIAVLPVPRAESILDQYRFCYPVSGEAVFTRPFSLEYRWVKEGSMTCGLLMLAHPLHIQLLNNDDDDDDCGGEGRVTVLQNFQFNSIDGPLVGIVGDVWSLKTETISVSWHSIRGIKEDSYEDIVCALFKDVGNLGSPFSCPCPSVHFYRRLIARAARLSMIAEEVGFYHAILVIKKFLKDAVEPWLDGNFKFKENQFLYDGSWGGIVNSGFEEYDSHHQQLAGFIYAIAVLVKIDPTWGRKYKRQAYALVEDYMNLGKEQNPNYTRLRSFDLYRLHSWDTGLTQSASGRLQRSSSQSVNAYYSAALLGLAYGDAHLALLGTTLAAFEIQAAKTWWHIPEKSGIYDEQFGQANKLLGVLWGNSRASYGPLGPDPLDYRLGFQVDPISPITEVLFSDTEFVKELVQWVYRSHMEGHMAGGWNGLVYALEAVYDKKTALKKIKEMEVVGEGNSLSNFMWWVHSRPE